MNTGENRPKPADVRRLGITPETEANERDLIRCLADTSLGENDLSSCVDLLAMLASTDALAPLRRLQTREGLSEELKKIISEAIVEIENG